MRSAPLHDVNEIQPLLVAAHLSAAVVVSPRNVWCLTGYPRARGQRPGYRRNAAAIAYPNSPPTLVTGRYQEEISLIRAWVRDVTSFADYTESPFGRAAEVLRHRGLASGRIGIESNYLPREFAADLIAGLDGASLVPCDDLLASAWGVKQDAELVMIKRNADRLSHIIRTVLMESRENESERALHGRLMSAIRFAGTSEVWGHVLSGHRIKSPGATSGDHILTSGDLVSIECSCTFKSYPARIGRMASVGRASDDQRKKYERLAATVQAAMETVRHGLSGSEAYRGMKDVLDRAGVELANSNLGHGLGIGFYERPALAPSEMLKIHSGMILCVDLHTKDGFRTSQMVEVSETGIAPLVDALPPIEQLLTIGA